MLTLIFKLITYNGDPTSLKIFSITRQVKLIEKKEFVEAALDPEHETFVVYIAILSINLDDKVHLLKKT